METVSLTKPINTIKKHGKKMLYFGALNWFFYSAKIEGTPVWHPNWLLLLLSVPVRTKIKQKENEIEPEI